jgi:hypothetical protein
MAVHAKRVVKGVGRGDFAVCAADILKEDHPLHRAFVKWLGDKSPTKRQAREFLKAHPQYRDIKNASTDVE